jgi:hypothetical protein
MIFKKEKECTELKLTMVSTYVTIWHILKISSMWKLIVIIPLFFHFFIPGSII